SRRKLIVQSRDGAALSVTPADPTSAGGALDILNPVSGESTLITLPANHWRGLGTPAGSRGYIYSDPLRTDGPCRKVLFKPGRSLKAMCSGAGIGFTLDE